MPYRNNPAPSSSTDPSSSSTSSNPLTTKRSRPRLPLPFTTKSTSPTSTSTSSGPKRDLAIAADASFVETTSANAARALAKWYGEQGGEEWAVKKIEKDGGRTVYRIRPRSRPSTPLPLPSPSHSSPTDTPFARGSFQPPSPPTTTSSSSSRPTTNHENQLRTSRSIPLLRTTPPPPTTTSTSEIPQSETERTLRRPGSTPTLSSVFIQNGKEKEVERNISDPSHQKRSRSNSKSIGSGSGQGDVLGRLLGWSVGPTTLNSTSSSLVSSSGAEGLKKRNAGTAHLKSVEGVLLRRMKSVDEVNGDEADVEEDEVDLRDDLPRDFEALDALNPPSPPTTTITNPTPSLPSFPFTSTSTSTSDEPPHPLLSLTHSTAAHEMREVASSDSIRTAKADDHAHGGGRGGKEKHQKKRGGGGKKRFQDPMVYDLFQRSEKELDTISKGGGGGHSRHASQSSFTSLGGGDGHEISISPDLLLNDDPRFVLWGPSTSSPSSTTTTANSSPTTTRKDPRFSSTSSNSTSSLRRNTTTSGGGELVDLSTPSSSPATTSSSRRWSLKGRDSISSPASSIRDSMSSSTGVVVGGGGGGRVLMAATVERLVAELTTKIEVSLLSGTFLVYRSFVRPIDLLRALISRFTWAMLPPSSSSDEASRRIVRVRTFVVIRHWLLNHFVDDFVPDRQLRKELSNWLNECGKKDEFRERVKELRLIKGLKRVAKAVKEEYRRENGWKIGSGSNELEVPGIGTGKGGYSDDDVDLDLGGEGNEGTLATSTMGSSLAFRRMSFANTGGGGGKKILVSPTGSSTTPYHSTTSSFPLPHSQNVVARSFTSALGTFGRFKRMLGNRGGVGGTAGLGVAGSGGGGMIGGSGMSSGIGGGDQFDDELEYERTDTGDLLWVKDGLERYLEFHNIPRDGDGKDEDFEDEDEDGDVEDEGQKEGQQTPSEMGSYVVVDEEVEVPKGLGIFQDSTTTTPLVMTSETISSPIPPVSLSLNTTSTFPSFTNSSNIVAPSFDPSPWISHNFSYLSHAQTTGRPQSTRIELDDVDLSDEDEDVVEVKKTLKRLPAASNLRMATTLKNLHLEASGVGGVGGYKHYSAESLESYGGHQLRPPSMGQPERESVMFIDDEENGTGIGVAVVPHFILDGIDSDDDDPGDVEAALRRLEGLVDASKEREKKETVERQMLKSLAQASASGTSNQNSEVGSELEELDEETDEFGSPVMSSSPSRGSSSGASSTNAPQATVILQSQTAPVTIPTSTSTPTPTPSSADNSTIALLPSREAALISTVSIIPAHQEHTSPTKRHIRTLSKRATLATKPSVSKIFTSTLSRPLSTRPSPSPSAGPTPPTHRSFILLCRTEVLAHQFCLIERDMFRLLSWQELVGGSWQDPKNRPADVLDWEEFLKKERRMKLAAKENGTLVPSTVQAMIARYNLTANWVASEVVLTFDIDERKDLIAKFIRLAFKCYCQNNYQTLTQIIHGLSLPDVERLKRTWARVPTWEMRKYISMKAFVAPERNFKLLRESTAMLLSENGVAGQHRTEQQARSPQPKGAKQASCLPFLGIFLKDLSTMSEQPTYLDPTCPSSPAIVNAVGALQSVADPTAFAQLPPLPEGMSLQPLVNIHKFRTISNVVQRLLSFQELAADYAFGTEPSLYLKALRIRCLDSTTMQECSLRLAQV